MAQLIWSVEAIQDAEDISNYIAQSSPANATAFADELKDVTETLPAMPRIGQVVPEFGRDDVRETLVKKFRVIYRIVGDDVIVVTVIRGSRTLPRNLLD